jgi:cAMP-binding proteins - catabolite gene activator and regulatory subunit of cAMP-dependent protein kinases
MAIKNEFSINDESVIFSSPEVIAHLTKFKKPARFDADQVIFRAGDEPQGIFILENGLVKIEVVSQGGATHTLRLVSPGNILGYRSLFAGEEYHATAIAVEDVEVSFVAKSDIFILFDMHPQLALKFLSHISKDLRMAEEKWLDQMDKGASERIAEALLFLREHLATGTWTRREIAAWAGTTPETVIRTLALFEKDGLIDQSDGRSINIIESEKLRERSIRK